MGLGRVASVYRDAFRGLPREVWWLAAAGFVHRAGTMVVPFLTLYLTGRRGYSVSEAGAVLAAYGLGGAAGVLLGGRLADRVGTRAVQVGSLALGGVLLLLLGEARGPVAVPAAAVALGLALESFRPANGSAFAALAPPGRRAQTFGLQRLAVNLGMSIGPALGGVLAVHDYAWLFRANAVACWLAAGVVARRVPDVGREDAPAAGSAAPGPPDAASPWRDRRFLGVLGLLLLQGLLFFQFLSTLPLYLSEEMGLAEDAVGLVFATNTLVIVLFEMALIRLVERRDPLRTVGVASVLIGIGFGLLPHGSGIPWALFTVVVWTVGEMLAAPMMMTFTADRAGRGSLGAYMAAFTLCFSLASVAAPALGTWVYAAAGPDALWHGVLAVGVLLGAAFWLVSGREASEAG